MNAATGAPLDGTEHLLQSIRDILSTPIGSRVMRRDYGSLLFELVDAPFNAATRIRMFAAVAMALRRWEPRLHITRIGVEQASPGTIRISLEGNRTDVPAPNSLANLTIPLRPSTFAGLAA